jgi:long-chain fatty acid transport protein
VTALRLVLLPLLLSPVRALAGGFEVYDQSPSGTGMAGAVSAKADDPSALFYNPAGIALHDSADGVQLGATLAFTQFSSRSLDARPITTNSAGGVDFLPQVYASTHLGQRIAVGVALFPQFGAGVRWNEKGSTTDTAGNPVEPLFPGRFVAQNTQLQALTINPSIGFRPNDRLAFGGGIDVVLASLELDRSVRFADVEGKAQVGGSARGVGFNAGVLAVVIPHRVAAAIAYRSAVGLSFDDLRAHFEAPPELKANVYDQNARTNLTLPHNFTFGLAFFPTEGLAITTDLHYTLWSELDKLVVAFPEGKTPAIEALQHWHDSWSARIGGEFAHKLGPGRLAVRGGFAYDLTPIPADTLNPAVPLADRLAVSVGVGYTVRGFGLAASYILGLSTRRASTDTDYPAEYRGNVSALSFAISYHWDRANKK